MRLNTSKAQRVAPRVWGNAWGRAVVVVLVVLAALAVVGRVPVVGDVLDSVIAFLAVLVLLVSGICGYFLPSLVGRRHRNFGGILVVNLFLGWTLIGWVVALAWAATDGSPRVQVQAHLTYVPVHGQRASGHWYDAASNSWVRL